MTHQTAMDRLGEYKKREQEETTEIHTQANEGLGLRFGNPKINRAG